MKVYVAKGKCEKGFEVYKEYLLANEDKISEHNVYLKFVGAAVDDDTKVFWLMCCPTEEDFFVTYMQDETLKSARAATGLDLEDVEIIEINSHLAMLRVSMYNLSKRYVVFNEYKMTTPTSSSLMSKAVEMVTKAGMELLFAASAAKDDTKGYALGTFESKEAYEKYLESQSRVHIHSSVGVTTDTFVRTPIAPSAFADFPKAPIVMNLPDSNKFFAIRWCKIEKPFLSFMTELVPKIRARDEEVMSMFPAYIKSKGGSQIYYGVDAKDCSKLFSVLNYATREEYDSLISGDSDPAKPGERMKRYGVIKETSEWTLIASETAIVNYPQLPFENGIFVLFEAKLSKPFSTVKNVLRSYKDTMLRVKQPIVFAGTDAKDDSKLISLLSIASHAYMKIINEENPFAEFFKTCCVPGTIKRTLMSPMTPYLNLPTAMVVEP
jgi:hypothetical protein